MECLVEGLTEGGFVLYMYGLCFFVAILMKAGFKEIGIFTVFSISTALFPLGTVVFLASACLVHLLQLGETTNMNPLQGLPAWTGCVW